MTDIWSDPAFTSALGEWLVRQRWFAGKDRSTSSFDVIAAIPVADDPSVTLLNVRVGFVDGEAHRYNVPVMTVAPDAATADGWATINDGPNGRVLDAWSTGFGAAAVIGAACHERVCVGWGGSATGAVADRRSAAAELAATLTETGSVRPLAVEQSNSSAMIGERWIAKLIRRFQPGPNPEVELTRQLSAVGFPHAPALIATLSASVDETTRNSNSNINESRRPDLPAADVLVIHDAVANDGELWSLAVDDISAALADDADPVSAARLARLPQLLGTRTAQLHRSLATPSSSGLNVAPEPFTLDWQQRLLARLRTEIQIVQTALRETAGGDPAGGAVRQPIDTIVSRFDRLADQVLDASRIRVHGDLHLGQILWTGGDLVFIDFEGEPNRPISERRVKQSPLIDVAGLLRSLDYAGRAAVARLTAAAMGARRPIDERGLDTQRRAWAEAAGAELVDTYLREIAETRLVPVDRRDAGDLLDLYLLHKGVYEIGYELANRPDWVSWPLSAVSEMITA